MHLIPSNILVIFGIISSKICPYYSIILGIICKRRHRHKQENPFRDFLSIPMPTYTPFTEYYTGYIWYYLLIKFAFIILGIRCTRRRRHRQENPITSLHAFWSNIEFERLKMSQLMRLWYLSHKRPAKAQSSLCIRTVSPEPSLFAHIKYGSRRRV